MYPSHTKLVVFMQDYDTVYEFTTWQYSMLYLSILDQHFSVV